jgi:spermidine/putrescine-binding protein
MIQLKYGYDFNTDIIGKWRSKANTAVAAGKVVDLDSNGDIAVANAFGYLLLQDVTTDGPSFNERELGVFQWDVKAGDPVAVVPPIKGAIIWTDNMGISAAAAGEEVEIATGGVFQKKASGTAVGKVISVPATGVYEIKLY